MDTRKLELQEGTDDLKIIDVGTDNGDEVAAVFLTGDEEFDKTDRIPLAKEMVKRYNRYDRMKEQLDRVATLLAKVQNDGLFDNGDGILSEEDYNELCAVVTDYEQDNS